MLEKAVQANNTAESLPENVKRFTRVRFSVFNAALSVLLRFSCCMCCFIRFPAILACFPDEIFTTDFSREIQTCVLLVFFSYFIYSLRHALLLLLL
jgi:hypothetical protein